MLPRILEPEVMDTRREAVDYNAMDHSQVNRAFVDDLLAEIGRSGKWRIDDAQHPLEILDVGTGTALIPIELCRRNVCCHIRAIDLAGEMLKVAAGNVERASLAECIRLERADAKRLPYSNGEFDAVISNSIVHHIAEPTQVVREMLRVLRPGGLLFVRDLLRPDDRETLEALVREYAGQENPHQQQMFRDSLHAALTLEEIRSVLRDVGLPWYAAQQSSDRHWTVVGNRPVVGGRC